MEPNLPVVARKLWSIVRVMFFMLRKGISRRKLMLDLNMMMKRGKIAGKAIHNLMFHHHHNWYSTSSSNRRSHDGHLSFTAGGPPHEYEFSCSNSPAFPFHLTKRSNHSHFFSCAHAPPTDDDIVTVNAVKKVLEMLNSEAASPALPGFGRSPMVRQLRITDSPFPLRDVDGDSRVDQAAEEFIMKFYNDLREQNKMAALG
uniref:Avr9/Cf-9 rapidly elicited protein 146 n=1 Tax=Davidia involucrata TaxID=16924 RepID=A0A5B7AWL9_DAVIN